MRENCCTTVNPPISTPISVGALGLRPDAKSGPVVRSLSSSTSGALSIVRKTDAL